MRRKNVYYVCFVESDSYRDVMTYNIVIHDMGTTLKLNHCGYALQWLKYYISVYEKYGTFCNYYIITTAKQKDKNMKNILRNRILYYNDLLFIIAPSATWFIRRHYE